MNLNKQKQPAIMQVYNAYWDNYIKGDVEAMHPLLDDDYTQVGSAEGEVFLTKKDAVQFLYDTIDQVAGKLEMRNRSIKLEQQDKIILIHECCDLYALAGGDWIFYSKFRASTLMQEKKEGWKITHQHSSFPDSKTDDGQNIAIEKIAAENLQLKEAVKRRTVELENKTRDLEIEASLERVRAVTLGMKKPADLPGICEVLFTELTTLGFAEIRNAMINIHDDDKATFINYDYSDEIGQSINHLRYDIHPVIEKQIRQIRSAGDAFSETYFKGKDLEDWKTFRKNIGEKDDPRIEKTKALYYYFYSIGTGSIGISTFNSIAEEKLNVLKRFRNVFDFAYRRYMDVAQAEAQAKEAQIELALERVRARAMAMQNSDELIYVADVMREQMGILGQQALDTCAVHLYPNDSTSFDSWYAFRLESTGKIVSGKTSFPKDGCELIREMIDGYNSKLGDYILEAKGAKLKEWMEVLANAAPELTNNIGEIPETGYYHLSDFSGGSLVMASFQPPSAESIVLQKKCANTFDLAYRRYLDLKKAEAQSREAQIELALERVRARTMAMQHSEELMDAANLLFQQVQSLGIPIWSCGYNIWEKGEQFCTGWMSTNGAIQPSFRIPLTESYTFMHMNESRQKEEPFYVDEVSGEALAEHYRYMFSLPDFKAIADEQLKDGFPLPTFQINHVFNFRHGNLIFLSGQPIREAWDIFKRFTAVFEQTYTRFLDLQKAEAQAREAQIQLALERVRARTMAMQKSDELPQAANLLFQQIQSLGMPAWSAGYCIWDDDKRAITLSMSSEGVLQPTLRMPLTVDPSLKHFREAYERGESFFVEEVGGEALKEHYVYLRTLPGLKETLDDIEKAGFPVPTFQIFHLAYFTQGFLLFITYEQVPESHDIFKRFAKVFEQTYTRFLDLQKAEAQAKEARIEAALEKVRSRSLAMHKSEELQEVVTTVLERMQDLDIQTDAINLDVFHENKKDAYLWTAVPGHQYSKEIHIPYNEATIFKDIYEGMISGKEIHSKVYSRELKDEFLNYVFEHTDFRYMPEERKEMLFATNGSTVSVAYAKNTAIIAQRYRKDAFSDDDNEILKRFARVFEQAYTRFLDLQKAEAQAKEAQIEAALEKVRSRSLAMHNANELGEVVTVIVEKLKDLGVVLDANGVILCTYFQHSKDVMHWIVSPDFSMAGSYLLPYFDHPIFNLTWQSKENGEEYFSKAFSVVEKNSFFEYAFEHSDYRHFPDEFKQWILQNDHHILSFAWQKNSAILIPSHTGVLPSEEDIAILKRFAKVFEQSYVRFLDLQKAEAQARESQIQLALERVRARTMAMQKSDELPETSFLLFQQVKELGLTAAQNSIGIVNEETGFVELSTTVHGQHSPRTLYVPINDPYVMANGVAAWRAKLKTLRLEFEGQELKDYNEHRNSFLETKVKFPEDRWIVNIIFFSKGWLSFSSDKNISDETFELLKRFAAVFEQTYTRFNDLKQAEAQAKEAQIETALEKVRSRSMGMQKSEELKEVIKIVYQQLSYLKINLDHAGFVVDYTPGGDWHFWVADEQDIPSKITHPYFESVWANQFNDAKEKGADFFATNLNFEEKNKFYNELLSYVPGLPEASKDFYLTCPGLAASTVLLSNVGLYIENFSGTPYTDEENKTLMRFGKVFQQTYTRFLDLQKAEAQAREATIEAALEKVRSRSLAMHKSDEIKDVALTVLDKIIELGIEMNGGVSLVTFFPDSQDFLHWLTIGPDFLNVRLPYFDHIIFKECADAREKGMELFANVHTGDVKRSYFKHLMEQTGFSAAPQDLKDWVNEQVYFGFSFAIQKHSGIFLNDYTGKFFSGETNEILIRFSKVFEQSYVRFLDLQKAEAQAREAKIEAALEKVRSRAMAMQKPGELVEVAELLRKEMGLLGVEELETSSIYIHHQDTQNTECWYAIKDIKHPDKELLSDYMNINLLDTSVGRQMLAFYQSGEMKISIPMEGIIRKEWINYCASRSKVLVGYYGDDIPDRTYHLYKFSNGYMGAASPGDISPESWDLLKRATAVFSLAYTRFSDLQRAEAHAVQAEEDLIKLQTEKKRAEDALNELQVTQKQLIQAEKMASLGELTAGIAHEIQNPLNFVNNFSEVSNELIDEMMEEVAKGNFAEVKAIADDVKQNLEKINHHGKRADGIVKGMLQHSHSTSSTKEPTDINKLADEYLHLAFHGLRAKDKLFNAVLKTDYDTTLEKINVIPQDIGRVILNLINNAFYAVSQRQKVEGKEYEPTVSVSTKKTNGHIEISVKDNGKGISQKIIDKIFQPFFTTKPTGQGTGLGLSLAYDIVKAHGGELRVETKEGEGSEFIIQLPII